MANNDHGADSDFRQDGLTIGHIDGLLQKGLTTGHIAEALGSLPAPVQGQGGDTPAAAPATAISQQK